MNRKRAEELAYKVLVLSLIWGEISGFHFLICETRDTQRMVKVLARPTLTIYRADASFLHPRRPDHKVKQVITAEASQTEGQ